MLKYYIKMALLQICVPQICLCFCFDPLRYFFKRFSACNMFILTQWPRGNAPDCGGRGTGLDSQVWQGFLCLLYFFAVVVILISVQNILYLHSILQLPLQCKFIVYI